MPLNFANAVRMYESLPVSDANRHMREVFADQHARAGFDFGRLFEECFGYEEFRACRNSSRELTAVYEAAGATSHAAFVNISGQIAYSTVLAGYQNEEFIFTRMIPATQTPFQMGEKIPGITVPGDEGQEVKEGDAIPLVGVSEDYIETPVTTKRALIQPVTREAVFGDRTGLLMDRLNKVGQTIGIKQEKEAVDAVIDENRTVHRYKWRGTTYATFQNSTPWINLVASTALTDESSIDTLYQLLVRMTDPFTGEPILIQPRHLIVPKRLERTANRIMKATNVRVGNYATSGSPVVTDAAATVPNLDVVSSRYLEARMATDTSWFMGNVMEAVKYMQNWPIEVTTAPPNSEKEFNNDIVMQFKASRKGEYVVVEPRALGKATA